MEKTAGNYLQNVYNLKIYFGLKKVVDGVTTGVDKENLGMIFISDILRIWLIRLNNNSI